MNAIIAYLPSGDKKVIIPSAHRYFIISSLCLPRERPSLFVAPTSTSCFLITVEENFVKHDTRPSFWGLINPQWSLCTKGRRQSPINIEPDKLLFDRHLRPVHVDKHRVIYLIFQSTKLQSDLRVEFSQVSGHSQLLTNFPSMFNSVDLYTINVTFSPRYFYRGTEALYGHLFPLMFNVLPSFSTGHAPHTGMGRGLGACKRPELACDEGIIATSVSLNVDSFYRVSLREISKFCDRFLDNNGRYSFNTWDTYFLNLFLEENTNLLVSGKDEIRARPLICRKRMVRRDEAGLLVRRKPHCDVTTWSRLVPLFKRGLGPFHSRRQPTNRPTNPRWYDEVFPNSWSVIAKLQSVWKTDLASFGNLVNTPQEPDFTSRV
ncbi:Putative carbonic anhydrase-like protein 2 [Acromyrmex echinatior]|uniref:Putative carbonic anhydrase-like protein 2 n=1 Tax=Acromyrmex echinatior TaxID=103372 RepID=F4X331_ACREC|nr:Putative carbonic anhydrase-like protein 2 [Acromyrmex echinatior]